MKHRHVLHIIETDGPGGAETVLVDLVRGTRTPHRAHAIVPAESGWLGRTLGAAERSVVGPSPRGASPVLDMPYVKALRASVRRSGATIVHAHSFDAGLYSALAVQGTNIPLVVTFHGASDVERRGLRNRIKWTAYRRAARIACVSEALVARARAVPGIPAERLRTVHNGSDLTRIPSARSPILRAALGLSSGTTLIGALGNVRAPKGYDLLLPAIAALRAEDMDVHLAIAGDDAGALGDALRAQRVKLGLEPHVTLLGYREDSGEFLAGLDVFVLSSTSEGFSISTVQASAAGLPIVATRSGGPEEIIVHGTTGLLVAAGSAEALSAGLRKLIQHPESGARMGAEARVRAAARFSLPAMLEAYDRLYLEVST